MPFLMVPSYLQINGQYILDYPNLLYTLTAIAGVPGALRGSYRCKRRLEAELSAFHSPTHTK